MRCTAPRQRIVPAMILPRTDEPMQKMTALRSEWGGIRRWQERVTWAGRKLRAAPTPVLILAIAVIAFLGFFAINLFYHVMRKPTEIFAFCERQF